MGCIEDKLKSLEMPIYDVMVILKGGRAQHMTIRRYQKGEGGVYQNMMVDDNGRGGGQQTPQK